MVIVNIIYAVFMVWMFSLFYALLESLWGSRKNKIPRPVSNTINVVAICDQLNSKYEVIFE